MNVIKVRQSARIEAFDGPTESVTPQLYDEIMYPVIENKHRILAGAADIEQYLELIIAHYFFGYDSVNKVRRERFMALVITSDWCTFRAKQRLISHIVNDTNALEGQKKNDYEKLLRDLISYRNAFTHGTLSTDGRNVKLAFYAGAPRQIFLDDDYFGQVESTINQCFSTTWDVAVKTGAIRDSNELY